MNKTALVTGASGGIGYELAKVLAEDRINLVLVARNRDKLGEIKTMLEQKYPIQVMVMPADLSRPESPQEIFKELKEKNIMIDILINNAGFGTFGFFGKNPWGKEEQMIQVNITALTHLTRLFLPGMIERKRGHILNVSSTAAFQPGPLMAVYYATKAYVQSFSQAIANEVRNSGIKVTVLCPGPTQSGFQDAAGLEKSKLFKGKKIATSQEVAHFGYQAMLAGKTVAIHGAGNRLLAWSVRFLPGDTVTSMVRKLQDTR